MREKCFREPSDEQALLQLWVRCVDLDGEGEDVFIRQVKVDSSGAAFVEVAVLAEAIVKK